MIKKFLPVLFLLIGVGVGAAAALFLGFGPVSNTEKTSEHRSTPEELEPMTEFEFVKLSNQFVVPVVKDKQVSALVVLSLSLEVKPGTTEAIYALEPRLRDGFLRVMFDHANMGGFDGSFTSSDTLDILRTALREVAQSEFGSDVSDVLIVGIVRQDV